MIFLRPRTFSKIKSFPQCTPYTDIYQGLKIFQNIYNSLPVVLGLDFFLSIEVVALVFLGSCEL